MKTFKELAFRDLNYIKPDLQTGMQARRRQEGYVEDKSICNLGKWTLLTLIVTKVGSFLNKVRVLQIKEN